MTEFDKQLIEKAKTFNRFRWQDINVLMNIADTKEAIRELKNIKADLYDEVLSTI